MIHMLLFFYCIFFKNLNLTNIKLNYLVNIVKLSITFSKYNLNYYHVSKYILSLSVSSIMFSKAELDFFI